ncbi:MAG: hypothetical protein KGI59_00350 [Patescibacteria group bacterium]|nr:hypothetical protein [Patescibacteria group bacterium]MDE2172670.1 hypothetical protein [Patescibacteria group bacterium]
METLTALFGSEVKIKVLRLFLFNPTTPFFLKEISTRTQALSRQVSKELRMLEKANVLIRKRQISKDIQATGRAGRITTRKVRGIGYVLNAKFPYLDPLKNLLAITSLHADESLAKRFTNAGRIKLFIASGVFIQNWDSRVDLLIVGDELNLTKIEAVISNIEAEIGKEIAYSAFETQDFEYRYGIHDRLVRDILDYPHVTLLDRIGIEPQ